MISFPSIKIIGTAMSSISIVEISLNLYNIYNYTQ